MPYCEASPFLLIFFFIDKAEQKLDKRKPTGIKKAVRKISFANCFVYINVSFDMFCPHYYAFHAKRTYNEIQCN